jgi:hypothetical protein
MSEGALLRLSGHHEEPHEGTIMIQSGAFDINVRDFPSRDRAQRTGDPLGIMVDRAKDHTACDACRARVLPW